MIGGSKVVGTLGRLDAELIADNKREKSFLDCLSFYLHGEDQIKKKSLLQDYSIQLSLPLSFSLSYYAVLKRKIVG